QHADGGFSDHQRHRQPTGRRSRNDGGDGGGAARAPVGRNCRRHRTHLPQLAGHDAHHDSIRPRSQYRWRRARRAGRDQRRTHGSAERPAIIPDFPQIQSGGHADLRLSAVASIELGVRDRRAAAWFNGQPSVLLVINKQANSNVIETVDRIYALLPELKRWIPAGVDISVLSDRTRTIRASVFDMQLTLIAPGLLPRAGVFVSLGRPATTIAAGVTVPLALAGTCAMMWVAGFSIDNLSLMALAVSVGFVVDDAIVMIENCFRNLEKGMSPFRA